MTQYANIKNFTNLKKSAEAANKDLIQKINEALSEIESVEGRFPIDPASFESVGLSIRNFGEQYISPIVKMLKELNSELCNKYGVIYP